MARESIVATGSKFLEVICPAIGVEPELVKRVIIDAPFDDIVQVYVEMIGSSKLLNIDFDLKEARITVIG